MSESWARRRRCVALGLAVLLPAVALSGQAVRMSQRPAPQAQSARPASVYVVHDGHGLVTAVGEQASVREVIEILSRWFDIPNVRPETVPDVRVPMSMERVPVAEAVDRLLRSAGLPRVSGGVRLRRTAPVRPSPLFIVHDGRGAVTVLADEGSTRDVLRILSRWFNFPIANMEAIPDMRTPMRFERVSVAQAVDRLLGGARINYVILTNPRTLVPTKVVAAPQLASTGQFAEPPRSEAYPAPPGMGGSMPYQPMMPGPMPQPMPSLGVGPPVQSPMPNDQPGIYQLYPPPLASGYPMPEPANPQPAGPTPAPSSPGANRPGVMTPTPTTPGKPPGGSKPPGSPGL